MLSGSHRVAQVASVRGLANNQRLRQLVVRDKRVFKDRRQRCGQPDCLRFDIADVPGKLHHAPSVRSRGQRQMALVNYNAVQPLLLQQTVCVLLERKSDSRLGGNEDDGCRLLGARLPDMVADVHHVELRQHICSQRYSRQDQDRSLGTL